MGPAGGGGKPAGCRRLACRGRGGARAGKDLVAVAPLASQAMVLVVNPAAGFQGVAGLITAAKARPGAFAYGSAGIGSGGHFRARQICPPPRRPAPPVAPKGGARGANETGGGG